MPSIRSAGVAFLATALAAAPLPAQYSWQLVDGASYERYSFAEPARTGVESLSLLVLPLGARLPVLGAVLEVSGAHARGELVTGDGTSYTISGLTDTRLSLEAPVAGPLRLGVTAVLPTGKSRLSDGEALVAGAIAADLLPFRITHWGSGGGVGVRSSVAHSFGTVGLAARATFMKNREFDAFESGGAAYRPGDYLRLQFAAEADLSSASRLSLVTSWLKSNDDRLAGANLYRSGDRLQAVGALSFGVGGRGSALAYTGWLHRSEGTHLIAPRSDVRAPAEDLLLMGGSLRWPFGRGVLAPAVDVRLYRNDAGLGQGYTAGTGLSLEWPIGGAVAIPTVRGRFGTVDIREGADSGFSGFEAGLMVRFGRRVE